jgi:hypothetical protein
MTVNYSMQANESLKAGRWESLYKLSEYLPSMQKVGEFPQKVSETVAQRAAQEMHIPRVVEEGFHKLKDAMTGRKEELHEETLSEKVQHAMPKMPGMPHVHVPGMKDFKEFSKEMAGYSSVVDPFSLYWTLELISCFPATIAAALHYPAYEQLKDHKNVKGCQFASYAISALLVFHAFAALFFLMKPADLMGSKGLVYHVGNNFVGMAYLANMAAFMWCLCKQETEYHQKSTVDISGGTTSASAPPGSSGSEMEKSPAAGAGVSSKQ